MEKYGEFVTKLRTELASFTSVPKKIWNEGATKNVNGLAGEELRRLISLDTRREYGAFFTDSLLGDKVLQHLKPAFNSKSIIYDSACGAGNLLISVSNYIYKKNIRFNTETQLLGTDLHQEFVEATQLRLITNSLLKQDNHSSEIFKAQKNKKYSIVKGNGLLQNDFYQKATHIIVNPPFNQIVANEKLSWAKGKVSAAALFIDKIIQNSNPGVCIIAILPDVLRSGSRYEKWRAMVEQECIIEKTVLLGQFDKYADVDVYAIKLTKRDIPIAKNNTKPKPCIAGSEKITHVTIKDLFDVSVGTVVDNRDPKKGPAFSYVISRGLKGWLVQKEIELKRKHLGKSIDSPFVVIKRTSRMGDNQRAIATVINIPNSAYVDNHLIVLKPKSGTLKDCLKALAILKKNKTNCWLNEKIRCRHLTVKVVSDIPFAY